MEEPPLRQEEEEEEEEGDEAGPEGALGKSPFQLTTEDVYDISYVMGRELMALGSDPRVTQLQFKIVRVLEMLETLVNEGNLTVEELRMERDNLRKEVEGLRTEGSAAGGQVNLGPDKMVVDLTDPNRPRFTLQELRDVLQERNKLKSQLLVVQEELQCYKRWGSAALGAPHCRATPRLQFLDTLCICSYFHSASLLETYSMPGTIPGTGL
ncbi:RILP-like protein 2 [Eumetopias jubatus]|uniref:RILP-like protein 2 n=1 Tax=Eumetopias jubatus TaxID=34886 RepID=UPI0010164AB3|nr:RILP-like protein 2 [Eumetopias jubatus]XP_027952616.1 RILP-like protein 2 [Eumetopias jubatus]